jgi:hypothetical protein
MKHYTAPWSRSLIAVSVFATLVCLGVPLGIIGNPHLPAHARGMFFPLGWLLIALPVICALFTIRGYTITADAILVHRLLWATRLPRAGLRSASAEPGAMKWSTLRTCGNGGFFSITGFYWNKQIGAFRAFVTDPRRTVVLRYEGRLPVVVSPAEPEDFVQALAKGA